MLSRLLKFYKTKKTYSEFCDTRPSGTIVDTIIVHSMYAPKHPEPFNTESCIDLLNAHKVSAHYIIGRDGEIINLVPKEMRAWHAGKSNILINEIKKYKVNDFSIGIELIGNSEHEFTTKQYNSLIALIFELKKTGHIKYISSHKFIALPKGRKEDPPDNFNWARIQKELSDLTFLI